MTLRRSGKVCVADASTLFLRSAIPSWQRTRPMAMGGGTDLRLVESIPAAARSLRKAGGHSRGISFPGMHSDLLALPASRLGGGLKVSFASNALTCDSLALY